MRVGVTCSSMELVEGVEAEIRNDPNPMYDENEGQPDKLYDYMVGVVEKVAKGVDKKGKNGGRRTSIARPRTSRR